METILDIPQYIMNEEEERKEILRRYRALLRALKPKLKPGDKEHVRVAFEMAVEAHKHMRRKSGEPYILHPLAVAMICVEEIGLGVRSTICALLHDTVEDTDITIEVVTREFGAEIAKIVDGLTKISNVLDANTSQQAENFKKILLTLTDDPRVILIKLADRLHNMRTLDSMKREKQLKIASETVYVSIDAFDMAGAASTRIAQPPTSGFTMRTPPFSLHKAPRIAVIRSPKYVIFCLRISKFSLSGSTV